MTPTEALAATAESVASLTELVLSIADEVAKLKARLNDEDRHPVEYRGVFQEHVSYARNALVTHGGGLWIALLKTAARPGEAGAGWKLIVKAAR